MAAASLMVMSMLPGVYISLGAPTTPAVYTSLEAPITPAVSIRAMAIIHITGGIEVIALT